MSVVVEQFCIFLPRDALTFILYLASMTNVLRQVIYDEIIILNRNVIRVCVRL